MILRTWMKLGNKHFERKQSSYLHNFHQHCSAAQKQGKQMAGSHEKSGSTIGFALEGTLIFSALR